MYIVKFIPHDYCTIPAWSLNSRISYLQTNLRHNLITKDGPQYRECLSNNHIIRKSLKLHRIFTWGEGKGNERSKGERVMVTSIESFPQQSWWLTCQQSNEHWTVAKVPEHEQLSPGDSTSSNVTKQVNMSIPETLLKAQYHLKKNILRTLSIISVLLRVATLKTHVRTCSVMWRSAHRHSNVTHDLA